MAFTPKVVLITGGSSGLGKAMCSRLAAMGHTVYGTARQVADEPAGWTMLSMEVTDEASIATAVKKVLEREGRIDVVVNNAGIGIQGPAEDIDVATAMRAFDTNLFGLHRVCRAVLPGMRAQRSGLVINISSIAANFGLPYRAFYSATKAAVNRYSEAMRIELRPFGVHVVVVEPGEFKTNIAAARVRPAHVSEAYAKRYDKAMAILDGGLGYSRDPDELAQVVARVIGTPKPKTIYRVAQCIQKFSVVLKKLLPGHRFERMLGKHYE